MLNLQSGKNFIFLIDPQGSSWARLASAIVLSRDWKGRRTKKDIASHCLKSVFCFQPRAKEKWNRLTKLRAEIPDFMGFHPKILATKHPFCWLKTYWYALNYNNMGGITGCQSRQSIRVLLIVSVNASQSELRNLRRWDFRTPGSSIH